MLYARILAENGYRIYATRHTAEDFWANGIDCTVLYKVREKKKPNIMDYLTNREIKLVINIPSHEGEAESRQITEDEYLIRRKAAEFGIPVVTNLELARALVKSLIRFNRRKITRPTPRIEALKEAATLSMNTSVPKGPEGETREDIMAPVLMRP